jgi:DNA-binding transcriptional ArsR family regulator
METHGVVLFFIASSPNVTIREMSAALGLTERRISQVIRDLAEAEYINVRRIGRRNAYSVNPEANFRHPTLSHITLGNFMELLAREPSADGPAFKEASVTKQAT